MFSFLLLLSFYLSLFFLSFFLSYFLHSFFFIMHNSKSIQCTHVLNIANDCSTHLLSSNLLWTSCEQRMVSYCLKTVPKTLHILMLLCELMYAWGTGCGEFARNYLFKEKFAFVLTINLVYLKKVSPAKNGIAYITCERSALKDLRLQECDSYLPLSDVSIYMYLWVATISRYMYFMYIKEPLQTPR